MENTVMNDEIMDNNFVENEVAMDFDEMTETSEEKDGLPVGKIVLGVLGLAGAAAVGAAIKNKEKIATAASEVKTKLDQKKIEKLEKKAQAIEEAKKKYVKIDEAK